MRICDELLPGLWHCVRSLVGYVPRSEQFSTDHCDLITAGRMGAGPRIKNAEQCGTASDFHLAAENERFTEVCCYAQR